MNRLLLNFVIILLFYINPSFSQNYIPYYNLINLAEEKFILEKDTSCYAHYDKAFKHFQPFLKDPFIAGQIALSLGDTLKFYDYLRICFKNGMPLSSIHASPIIKKVYTNKIKVFIDQLFKESYITQNYEEDIINEICLKCYRSDSIKMFMATDSALNNLFYLNENQTRKYLYDNFLIHGKFPNERLIGISTDEALDGFYERTNLPDVYVQVTGKKGYINEEFELRAKCPFNIILHSKCFYNTHRELFILAMEHGYLHPKELGILEESAMLWHKSDQNPEEMCEPPEIKIAYNIFGNDPRKPDINTFTKSEEGLLMVEANRKHIHLQKFSIDQLKKKSEKELGIKFFFDFKDR